MLELLQDRDSIQNESSNELGRKFHNFDIECVDVLIGKPDTQQAGGKIETLLEQLRLRQLSLEQVETYSKQVMAAQNLRVLNEAQAQAQMQTQLSNSMVKIKIAENDAEAQLARARKQAEQVVVTAEAESQQRILAGRGEGARILQEGFSEASVLLRKISSFSDPRLYALTIAAQNLARCSQPLVPERVFISGGRRHGRRGGRRSGRYGHGCDREQRGLWSLAQHARGRKIGLQSGRPARRGRPARFHREDRQAGHGSHPASRRRQRRHTAGGSSGDWKWRRIEPPWQAWRLLPSPRSPRVKRRIQKGNGRMAFDRAVPERIRGRSRANLVRASVNSSWRETGAIT